MTQKTSMHEYKVKTISKNWAKPAKKDDKILLKLIR